MKRLLPSPVEAAIFAALAIFCGILVHLSPAADVALAGIAMPVFIVAGMMGMRRNWSVREAEDAAFDEPNDSDVT
jgi:hypothetical protein